VSDPVAKFAQLRPLVDQLAALMGRLPPGSPEYQAAYSACAAFERAQRVLAHSPRWARLSSGL
jgi:hypothetical protein